MIMRKSKPASSHRIALALAGGGPMGAIYEIGALCALEDALTGINFTQLNHYVGVSAGGFIAASMANGLTPRKLCGSFIENNSPASDVFDPAWLMMPAYDEFARRAIMLPGLMMAAFWELAVKRKSITHALERFSPGLPTGIFSNEEIHRRLSAQFSCRQVRLCRGCSHRLRLMINTMSMAHSRKPCMHRLRWTTAWIW